MLGCVEEHRAPCEAAYQDTGFQGYQPPGVTIYQPKKKPKGPAIGADRVLRQGNRIKMLLQPSSTHSSYALQKPLHFLRSIAHGVLP